MVCSVESFSYIKKGVVSAADVTCQNEPPIRASQPGTGRPPGSSGANGYHPTFTLRAFSSKRPFWHLRDAWYIENLQVLLSL